MSFNAEEMNTVDSKCTASEASLNEDSDSDSTDSPSDSDSDSDSDDGSLSSSSLNSDDEEFLTIENLTLTNLSSVFQNKSANNIQVEMNDTQVSVMLAQMRLTHEKHVPDSASVRTSHSLPKTLPSTKAAIPRRRRMYRASVTGISPMGPIVGKDMASEDGSSDPPPIELFEDILEENGYTYRDFESSELDDYFVPVTPDRVKGYCTVIIEAVRSSDIATLRIMHFEEKRNLNCCNKFGESILHTACRRGLPDVVSFLIKEAKVDLRVVDDYGRTPMHDACWTSEPNMELVILLVTEWPDLLLIKDKRGFTPLQYVRNTHFEKWCEFLRGNNPILLPKLLIHSKFAPSEYEVSENDVVACRNVNQTEHVKKYYLLTHLFLTTFMVVKSSKVTSMDNVFLRVIVLLPSRWAPWTIQGTITTFAIT